MDTVKANWKAITAMDDNRGIGLGGRLPWSISEEYAHFKRTTMGHILLMGRRTWEEIGSKPLPGRDHWILSGSLAAAEGARVFPALEDVLAEDTDKTVFVAGGATIYRQCFPLCAELILTRVHGTHEVDTHLPPFEDWFIRHEVLRRHPQFTVERWVRNTETA